MGKFWLVFVSLFFGTLLQCSIFPMIPVIQTIPNILLGLSAVFGLMYGKRTGMFSGVAAGILLDIFSGTIIGYNAFVLCLIGYVSGSFNDVFFPENYRLPLVALSASDLLYGFFTYFFFFFTQGDYKIVYYFFRIMLPELVFTVIVMVFVYLLLLHLDEKIQHRRNREGNRRIV